MKRRAESFRAAVRRAALAVGVLAGTALAGGDNTMRAPPPAPFEADGESPQVFVGDASDSGDAWDDGSLPGIGVYDPYTGCFTVWEEPTGGFVYVDTTGGEAEDLAASWGFDVHDVYGGVCCGTPSSGAYSMQSLVDAIWLCAAINGMDAYANAEPEVWIVPPEDFCRKEPEGSQSNGIVLPSTYGRFQFQRQTALTSIQARAAHLTATGAGVVVAVLDTGADARHPLLAGHVLPGHDFVDGDDRTNEGPRDRRDQDRDGKRDEGYGHGTAISGLVLASAPDARILPVRVLDAEGQGTSTRVAAGILWAVDHGADVVNLSLGGGYSQTVSDALAVAQDAGVIVVAAAGRGAGQGVLDYPASDVRAIAVSSGPALAGDVAAPGTRVAGPYPGNRWYRGTGTSFATALTAGGVALTLQRHPGATRTSVLQMLGAPAGGEIRTLPVALDLLRLVQ
jgi:subtilisin family serine protease